MPVFLRLIRIEKFANDGKLAEYCSIMGEQYTAGFHEELQISVREVTSLEQAEARGKREVDRGYWQKYEVYCV